MAGSTCPCARARGRRLPHAARPEPCHDPSCRCRVPTSPGSIPALIHRQAPVVFGASHRGAPARSVKRCLRVPLRADEPSRLRRTRPARCGMRAVPRRHGAAESSPALRFRASSRHCRNACDGTRRSTKRASLDRRRLAHDFRPRRPGPKVQTIPRPLSLREQRAASYAARVCRAEPCPEPSDHRSRASQLSYAFENRPGPVAPFPDVSEPLPHQARNVRSLRPRRAQRELRRGSPPPHPCLGLGNLAAASRATATASSNRIAHDRAKPRRARSRGRPGSAPPRRSSAARRCSTTSRTPPLARPGRPPPGSTARPRSAPGRLALR